MTPKEALEILKSRNTTLKLNHKIGNRDIAINEVKGITKEIDSILPIIEQALEELEELKANQIKIKTIEDYGIDNVLAVIQGLKAKEITPEILRNHLKMYKAGYGNGIKVSRFYIEQALKNIKGGEE